MSESLPQLFTLDIRWSSVCPECGCKAWSWNSSIAGTCRHYTIPRPSPRDHSVKCEMRWAIWEAEAA